MDIDICSLTLCLPCCCLLCCLFFFSSSAYPQTDTAQLYNTHPDSCTHTDRTSLEFNLSFASLQNKNSSHRHLDIVHFPFFHFHFIVHFSVFFLFFLCLFFSFFLLFLFSFFLFFFFVCFLPFFRFFFHFLPLSSPPSTQKNIALSCKDLSFKARFWVKKKAERRKKNAPTETGPLPQSHATFLLFACVEAFPSDDTENWSIQQECSRDFGNSSSNFSPPECPSMARKYYGLPRLSTQYSNLILSDLRFKQLFQSQVTMPWLFF